MMEDPHGRIVAHFDLDAFYVGCEREANPSLIGLPVAVSQYNPLGNLKEVRREEIERRLIVTPEKPGSGDQNGSLIAVSYEARACEVKRNMRVSEAVTQCPSLCVVQVPVKHGKADLTIYRHASERVLSKLIEGVEECALTKDAAKKILVEKASIDEIYVDLTSVVDEYIHLRFSSPSCTMAENNKHWDQILDIFGAKATTIGGLDAPTASQSADGLSKDELRRGSSLQVKNGLGSGSKHWWNRKRGWTEEEIRLAVGAGIACQARANVAEAFFVATPHKGRQPTYTLSAGISHNKTLAKLASGMRKPNSQTICCADAMSLRKLFHPLPLGRIRGLGGKLGQKVSERLNISTVGELAEIPLSHLRTAVDEGTAQFLYDISRGRCRDPVNQRTAVKSIGCGKTFRGALAFSPKDVRTVERWVKELSDELKERLIEDRNKNCRVPQNFGVTIKYGGKHVSKSSSSMPRDEKYREVAVQLVQDIVSQCNLSTAIDGTRPLIEGLTIFVGSFIGVASGNNSITAAFGRATSGSRDISGKSSSPASPKMPQASPREASQTTFPSANTKHPVINKYSIQEAFAKGAKKNNNIASPLQEGKSSLLPSSSVPSDNLDPSVDPDVFRQLPVHIQNEIRATNSRGCTKNGASSREKKGTSDGMISSWLKGASRIPGENTPTHDQAIDKDVFAELPKEIQAEILRSPRNQLRRPKKKARSIDAFFRPNQTRSQTDSNNKT